MFFHDKFGLVSSHTREQFEKLARGEAFSVMSLSTVLKLRDHMAAAKSWKTFPNQQVTREQAAFVLAHFGGGADLNTTCPKCGHEINARELTKLCDGGDKVTSYPYPGVYQIHLDCGDW